MIFEVRFECYTLAKGSFPVMSYVMVVGELSEDCSKVTVPVTLESPRTTATREDYISTTSRTKKQMLNEQGS